uniref:Angiogenic factor with G patch and FHA domains 1 n=1 Tax=Astyanax mexicanus TaxID=7994 RepID=A0A3B1IVY6_ASTMX
MASDAEEICTSDPVDQEMQESSKSTEESVEAEKTNGGHIESLALKEEEKEEEREKEGEESVHESVCPQTAEPVSDISCQQSQSGCEVAVLQKEVERLQRELKECQSELQKVQKQLSHSVRLQKSTESYNQDLRQQVEKLSVELHERKKKEKNRVEAETQTEEYTWTETDYYNYYYGGYYQSTTEGTAEADPTVSTDAQETTEQPDSCPMATETTAVSEQPSEEMSVVTGAEVTEAGGEGSSSIADMLRATAEEALNQTGFVFDENSGMYYDHATGFYYDSTNQLYYDANTGMYYYYDTESGKYQFHSRIELPTAQPTDQPVQTSSGSQEKISKKKSKRTTEKPARLDNKDQTDAGEGPEEKCREELSEERKEEPRRKERRSRSRSKKRSSRSNGSGRRENRRRRRNRSRSDDRRDKKRKKKRSSKSKKARPSDTSGESEPEEGEITGSEGENKRSSSSSSSSSSRSESLAASPSAESPERETQTQEEAWPPCVRVTVVRSPVLQPGTLFILTADAAATIGREKDMNHAIRIPEMGVSKSHAEVFFDQDQQCYMLVDQGSQNGTVINGNRILQPKVRCDPCALTHGDEVKLGETVLSFHIHSGTDTCDGCEPGQVRAHLNRHRQEESTALVGILLNDLQHDRRQAKDSLFLTALDKLVCVLSKEEKEVQRQKELKQIKIKYGLKSSEYEESGVIRNSKYKDRAETRRQTVGSEGTFFRDDAPASLHVLGCRCVRHSLVWVLLLLSRWRRHLQARVRNSRTGSERENGSPRQNLKPPHRSHHRPGSKVSLQTDQNADLKVRS